MTVYSADRVGRLRIVLSVVVAIGVFLALFASYVLVADDGRRFGVFSLVVAGVLLGSSWLALRLLPDRNRPAKQAAVVTGVLVILSGILMAGTWLVFLLPVLGLGLLFLAVIPDEDEATP